MKNRTKATIAGVAAAAALTAGLYGVHVLNGPSFEDQIQDALPQASMKQADRISDAICDQGLMAGAFQLGAATEQTSEATLALTVHKCRDSFADQAASFATAFSEDDPTVKAGIQGLRQIDPDDADAVLAFATSDGSPS